MIARVGSFLFFAVPLMVVATSVPHKAGGGSTVQGKCNTGTLSCCESVQAMTSGSPTLTDPAAAGVADADGGGSLLDVTLDLVAQVLLGVNCSPISVAGLGANSCSSQPVCCEENKFGGSDSVNVACTPVNLTL